MESTGNHVETLIESATAYGQASYELVKLRIVEKISRNVSALALRLVVILLVAGFILLVSMGVALWLGKLLGADYYGYFIVSGSYLLVAIALHTFLKAWMQKLIEGSVIKELLD